MDVGSSYEDILGVQDALEKLKRENHHPLRVYNSQKAEDYNKKRVSAKETKAACWLPQDSLL